MYMLFNYNYISSKTDFQCTTILLLMFFITKIIFSLTVFFRPYFKSRAGQQCVWPDLNPYKLVYYRWLEESFYPWLKVNKVLYRILNVSFVIIDKEGLWLHMITVWSLSPLRFSIANRNFGAYPINRFKSSLSLFSSL